MTDSSASNPAEEGGEARTPARLARGTELIASLVKTLPDRPGVYRMLDVAGEVLYVGKARSLKKRVSSYARPTGHVTRIARMIAETHGMEFVTTETETEALLLEANLIKRLRPRFNVLMRDDKSFPYILVTGDHEAPALVKHRGARARRGAYFGPFASAGAVNRTLTALQKAFLLRTCTDSVYQSRTRPCLLHQIKRCAGPCTREISLEAYDALAREAKAFLSGRSAGVRDHLVAAMETASERLDFEMAAVYRDRLAALSTVTASQGVNPRGIEEADVFAIHQEGGQTCVQVFFFRAYQNWGNRAYFPKADPQLAPEDVLAPFIAQFYDDKPVPRLILLSNEIDEVALLAEALSSRREGRTRIEAPRRGEKRDLVDHALANARDALGRRLAESSTHARLLAGLADAFGLDGPPQRVEVYDNSHIMGANAVGAMIVAGPEGLAKSQYRRWNIRAEDIAPGDDYGMMREVLRRRFGRLLREAGPRGNEETGPWPDLVILDGGQGQLNAAREIFAELGIGDEVPLVAVAKGPEREAGRERFFMEDRAPFQLAPRDPVLYFVQRLRDEAHRFAIGAHRRKRSNDISRNPLDDIPGIGPARKRALLRHFGGARDVARASLEDLLKVPGVNAATAKAVWAFFNEGG